MRPFAVPNASRSPPEPFFDKIYEIFQNFRTFQPFAAISLPRSHIYRSHLETASRFRPPVKIIDFRLHLRKFASICGPKRPQSRFFAPPSRFSRPVFAIFVPNLSPIASAKGDSQFSAPRSPLRGKFSRFFAPPNRLRGHFSRFSAFKARCAEFFTIYIPILNLDCWILTACANGASCQPIARIFLSLCYSLLYLFLLNFPHASDLEYHSLPHPPPTPVYTT